MRRPAKFGTNRVSRAGDIEDFYKSKILDPVQMLKLSGNISIVSLQRPGQFCRNRSSRSGDIKDFCKSKMAAQPPSWIYSESAGRVRAEILLSHFCGQNFFIKTSLLTF